MPVRNPYADLRALLDVTRQLTPEEMAELQLEQGYVDRALSIYDELTRRDPHNTSYATRRAWLARMAAVRPVRRIGEREGEVPLDSAEPRERRATLNGVGPRTTTEDRAALAEPADAAPAVVRALRIVRVR